MEDFDEYGMVVAYINGINMEYYTKYPHDQNNTEEKNAFHNGGRTNEVENNIYLSGKRSDLDREDDSEVSDEEV